MNRFKIIALLSLALVTPRFLQTEYTVSTTVIDVIEPDNINPDGLVICADTNGMKYVFDGSEDWFEGDIAEITLNDNGTAFTTEDDEIVKTIYKGYIY